MGFDMLLGNERLKKTLSVAAANDSFSHFYLICGPAGSGKKTLGRLLSAAILCKSGGRPCLQCEACRKVMAATHPDILTVRDPEHKNVSVKIIRRIREEMFILPNEADKKICLFPQMLGPEGQNALLKILEEPPRHGVFLLFSENPEALLPTVRSRCTLLQLDSLPETLLRQALTRDFPDASREDIDAAIWRSGGYLGQARTLLSDGDPLTPETVAFARAFSAKDSAALLKVFAPIERKKEGVGEILIPWLQLLEQALVCRSGMPAATGYARTLADSRSPADLNRAINELRKAIRYADSNVSGAAICGYLSRTLR